MIMKKRIVSLTISLIVITIFSNSCENDDNTPTPRNDTIPNIDTLTYLEFNENNDDIVPIQFDSIVKLFPNSRLCFVGNEDITIFAVNVYKGTDTLINGVKQTKLQKAKLYKYSRIKNWDNIGTVKDSSGFIVCNNKTYYNFNLNMGDTFQSKIFTDSLGTMTVDSIISKTMLENTQKQFFYLSSKYSHAEWIENIGITYGELEIGMRNDNVGGGWMLLRYYECGKLIYSNPLDGIAFVAK